VVAEIEKVHGKEVKSRQNNITLLFNYRYDYCTQHNHDGSHHNGYGHALNISEKYRSKNQNEQGYCIGNWRYDDYFPQKQRVSI
jgi:hypothetical protein